MGADTGERRASDCYRDGSPSVQSNTHTHAGQQRALSEALQEEERWKERDDRWRYCQGVINKLHAPCLSACFSINEKDCKQEFASTTAPHLHASLLHANMLHCVLALTHQASGTETCEVGREIFFFFSLFILFFHVEGTLRSAKCHLT